MHDVFFGKIKLAEKLHFFWLLCNLKLENRNKQTKVESEK